MAWTTFAVENLDGLNRPFNAHRGEVAVKQTGVGLDASHPQRYGSGFVVAQAAGLYMCTVVEGSTSTPAMCIGFGCAF